MKRSLKNILGYSARGLNGPEGKVNDLLFDEETWRLRYLDVDFGDEVSEGRHLIPSAFLEEPEWENEMFPVNLKKEHIAACPDLDEQMPVSRKYEEKLVSHYGIDAYWPHFETNPTGAGVFYPPRPITTPKKIINEDELETNLRSFNEVKGYAINASGKPMGSIVDIIIDDEDWQLVYLIVDTNNWLPWSRKVILAVDWLDSISFVNREVSIDLDTDAIKDAPRFKEGHPVDMDYERALHEYYREIHQKQEN